MTLYIFVARGLASLDAILEIRRYNHKDGLCVDLPYIAYISDSQCLLPDFNFFVVSIVVISLVIHLL